LYNKDIQESKEMSLMKHFYLKQKVFSFGDKYKIYDENQNLLYFIKGQVFSLSHKMTFIEAKNDQVLFKMQKRLFTFLPLYYLFDRNDEEVLTAKKLFSPFAPKIKINSKKYGNLEIEGNFYGFSFTIKDMNKELASVRKKWISWGDSYEITIFDDENIAMLLSLVILIDSIYHRNKKKNS
jgi:uncharacterized protein YxjI